MAGKGGRQFQGTGCLLVSRLGRLSFQHLSMGKKFTALQALYTAEEIGLLQRLIEMGFARDRAMLALIRCQWQPEAAIPLLTEELAAEPRPGGTPLPGEHPMSARSDSAGRSPGADLGGGGHSCSGGSAPPSAAAPVEMGYIVLRAPDGREHLRGRHRVSWGDLMERIDIPRADWPRHKRGWYIRLWESEATAAKLWRAQRLCLPIPDHM